MENTEKKNRFLLLISLISLIALVFTVLITSGSMPVFAQNQIVRTMNPSTDYTTEFYCRMIDGDTEKYVTYNGENRMTVTSDPSEALFNIEFVTNSTIKISRVTDQDETIYLGHKITLNGTPDLANKDTVWTLNAGSIMDGNRILLCSTSGTSANMIKAYDSDMTGNKIYFYTTSEYNESSTRCSNWAGDSDRAEQLNNLAFNIGSIERCIVSFEPGEGTGSMESIKVIKGSTFTLPSCTFIPPADKEFDYWSIDDAKQNESITVNSDVTLIANWKESSGQQINPEESWHPITLSTDGGTKASKCTVNGIAGIKAGTSSDAGSMIINIKQGSSKVKFYIAGWNKDSVTVSFTPNNARSTVKSIKLTSNSGINGNSPFTLSGSSTAYLQTIDLSSVLSDTYIQITATVGKRFVVWGAEEYYK